MKSKYRLFGICCIIFLGFGLTFKYFQNDTFYMLKLGDYIYHNGIDFLDHYCWITNLSYTYPHWLYDLFIYVIYKYFNFYGVYFSVIVTFIILLLSIYYVNLKLNKNEFFSIVISIIVAFRLFMFAVARAQLLSLLCFVLEFYFIYQLINSGKKKYSLYLFILCVLVANIHATVWPFYFILYLPFIVEHISNKFFKLRNSFKLKIEEISNFKLLLSTFVLSLFLGVLSPSKICYTYIFRIMLGNSQEYISEHFPLTVIENPYFIIVILILLIVLIFTETKIYLRELLLIGGLIFMCLSSTRHLSFFYSIALIQIGVIVIRCLDGVNDVTFDILGSMLISKKVIYYGLLIFILMFSIYKYYNHSKENFVLKKEYPVGAVSYIKDNLDYKNIRLYNGYNYGSYLLFNDIPVFIDSRCDLYLKEFNGMKESIFDVAYDIELDYEKEFEKYGVSYVLLPTKNTLTLILNKDSSYRVLYRDKHFVLFEKNI